MTRYLIAALLLCTSLASAQKSPEYQLLATSRTSTMEKEINDMAREGYQLAGTMGGDTHEGEIIVTMRKLSQGDDKDRFQYKLLATSRTGTMQRELQEAADQGYEYAGVMARGEVMVILERDKTLAPRRTRNIVCPPPRPPHHGKGAEPGSRRRLRVHGISQARRSHSRHAQASTITRTGTDRTASRRTAARH